MGSKWYDLDGRLSLLQRLKESWCVAAAAAEAATLNGRAGSCHRNRRDTAAARWRRDGDGSVTSCLSRLWQTRSMPKILKVAPQYPLLPSTPITQTHPQSNPLSIIHMSLSPQPISGGPTTIPPALNPPHPATRPSPQLPAFSTRGAPPATHHPHLTSIHICPRHLVMVMVIRLLSRYMREIATLWDFTWFIPWLA